MSVASMVGRLAVVLRPSSAERCDACSQEIIGPFIDIDGPSAVLWLCRYCARQLATAVDGALDSKVAPMPRRDDEDGA